VNNENTIYKQPNKLKYIKLLIYSELFSNRKGASVERDNFEIYKHNVVKLIFNKLKVSSLFIVKYGISCREITNQNGAIFMVQVHNNNCERNNN